MSVALRASCINKWYGKAQVLQNCSLELNAGEIVGLAGSNGAGKSTLIRILTGAEQSTDGVIELDNKPVSFAGPMDAQKLGIFVVHQDVDQSILPGSTVADTLLLDRLASGDWPFFVRSSWLFKEAEVLLEQVGYRLDPRTLVEDLPIGSRQEIVLARAISRHPRVLVLDEPTSSLSAAEVDVLIRRLRLLRDDGVAIMFVSHRLDEIGELCDRVVVMRDGSVVDETQHPFDLERLARGIVGTVRTDAPLSTLPLTTVASSGPCGSDAAATAALSAVGIRTWDGALPIDFVVRESEILGVTGLIGSGKTELLEQLAGVRPLVSGTVKLWGAEFRPRNVREAVRRGIGFVSEDRARRAVFPGWSIGHHRTIPFLKRFCRGSFISKVGESDAGRVMIRDFGVKARSPQMPLDELSGGNQQKVIVFRWLAEGQSLLVLDEPFHGIDVGARRELGEDLRRFVGSGKQAAIIASSDPRELMGLVDRILVLSRGKVVWFGDTAVTTLDDVAAAMVKDLQVIANGEKGDMN